MNGDNKTSAIAKLLIALTQASLFGGLALFWERVQQRPVTAVLIAIIYEAVVFGIAFAKKVWGIVEDTAVHRTADWILASLSGFSPDFLRRYKRQVVRDHSIFSVRGLGETGTYALDLERIFVDLRIAPSTRPRRANLNP